MQLRRVYIRFFKSFNFDYLRQERERTDANPWDEIAGSGDGSLFYPFVEVDVERDVTTVVGGNESGKTQLISAIEKLLGETSPEPRDFCRYSTFFGVQGKLARPEFGGRFVNLSPAEEVVVRQLIDPALSGPITEFWFFKLAVGQTLFVRVGGAWRHATVDDVQRQSLRLPRARRIRADVILPENLSLHALTKKAAIGGRTRRDWYAAFGALADNEAVVDEGDVTKVAALIPKFAANRDRRVTEKQQASFDLARKMLEEATKVDPRTFEELLNSRGNDDGYGNALTARLTEAIGVSLNFPKWWSQDRDFSLEVHKDGFHLVLTMRDRTGQTYTFDERSGGMQYFLSYFIQYQAYQRVDPSQSEIILMDEPDAYLSMQGQQDLLHILEAYAYPEDEGRHAAQVVYVTHSPFLIDKNHPERIRVLQKGLGEEGTRVVRKASIEKFEPLRTALGPFHAETAFIGTCNLLVEGPADQVLIAAISSSIRRDEETRRDAMDLNQLTIVPVHGASQYRYSLHMTRGRGFDKPAVVVLLDSDPAGKDARLGLELSYKGEQIIDPSLILAIGDLDRAMLALDVDEVQEPEDLLPVGIARTAVVQFAREVLAPAAADEFVRKLPRPLVVPANGRLYDGLKAAVVVANDGLATPLSIGKVELARSIADLLSASDGEPGAAELPLTVSRTAEPDIDQTSDTTPLVPSITPDDQVSIALGESAVSELDGPEVDPADLKVLHQNFAALFRLLNRLQADAMRESTDEQVRQLTKRLVERFKQDHRTKATKHSFANMLAELESQLPGVTEETERIRGRIRSYRETYKLAEDPATDIDGFFELRGLLTDELVYGGLRDQEDVGTSTVAY